MTGSNPYSAGKRADAFCERLQLTDGVADNVLQFFIYDDDARRDLAQFMEKRANIRYIFWPENWDEIFQKGCSNQRVHFPLSNRQLDLPCPFHPDKRIRDTWIFMYQISSINRTPLTLGYIWSQMECNTAMRNFMQGSYLNPDRPYFQTVPNEGWFGYLFDQVRSPAGEDSFFAGDGMRRAKECGMKIENPLVVELFLKDIVLIEKWKRIPKLSIMEKSAEHDAVMPVEEFQHVHLLGKDKTFVPAMGRRWDIRSGWNWNPFTT